LSNEFWRKVEEVFYMAMRLELSKREEFVESACAGREDVRREVKSLLASASASERFLEDQ
jgi:hypothetical protein